MQFAVGVERRRAVEGGMANTATERHEVVVLSMDVGCAGLAVFGVLVQLEPEERLVPIQRRASRM
jgi:hypothetical protein